MSAQLKQKKANKAVKKIFKKGKPGKLRGHGAYSLKDVVGKVVDAATYDKDKTAVGRIARFAGNTLGNAIHPALGKVIGNAASWFTSLFGGGRYSVNKNSLLTAAHQSVKSAGCPCAYMPTGSDSGFVTNSPPSFNNRSNSGSDVILTHREYVADVLSSIAFTTTTYPINPGNAIMFPWLSQIASLYEEYEFLGLIFEYKTMSATAVGTTSSAMGNVIMATDYDCTDSNFANKRQMEAAEYACSTVPFETFIHPIECDRRRNVLSELYVVPNITSSVQAPGDPRLSVLGNFTIATQGQQLSGTAIGELWVSYHIRLSRPILESFGNQTAPCLHATTTVSAAGVVANLTVQGGAGAMPTLTKVGIGPLATLTATAGAAPGTYMMCLRSSQASLAVWVTPTTIPPVLTAGATIAGLSYGYPGGTPTVNNAFTSDVAVDVLAAFDTEIDCAISLYIFTLPNNISAITVPILNNASGTTGVDVYVTQWNPGVMLQSRKHLNEADSLLRSRIERIEQALYSQPQETDEEGHILSSSSSSSRDAVCAKTYSSSSASSSSSSTSSSTSLPTTIPKPFLTNRERAAFAAVSRSLALEHAIVESETRDLDHGTVMVAVQPALTSAVSSRSSSRK